MSSQFDWFYNDEPIKNTKLVKNPTIGIGSNAVLTVKSDSIGVIKKTILKDVGFDYPSDNTLRPTA